MVVSSSSDDERLSSSSTSLSEDSWRLRSGSIGLNNLEILNLIIPKWRANPQEGVREAEGGEVKERVGVKEGWPWGDRE